jgi:hypothetical protein
MKGYYRVEGTTFNTVFGIFGGAAGEIQPIEIVNATGDVWLAQSGDKVGIRTTDPNQALDVDGTAQVESLIVDYFVANSVTAGITATNPGGQGDNVLTKEINEVSTVGTADDAVTLPAAAAGRRVRIINNGANQLEIWPNTDDDAGAGANTAITLAAGSNLTLIAYNAVNWESF